MAHSAEPPPGPDFSQGVPLARVPREGVLAGHVAGAPVLLARLDDGLHAVAGACTHYGAPLAEGLVVDGEIHCPWHHACFSLHTGAALSAPAFAGLETFAVEAIGDTVFVREARVVSESTSTRHTESAPNRIVIIGGGAAGFAAAERLRSLGYAGEQTLQSSDNDAPKDRPNQSKDYLARTAPQQWIPLKDSTYYAGHGIRLELGEDAVAIDPAARSVTTSTGARIAYDALLIATGAEPRRLSQPGFDRPNVYTLRSLADARAVLAAVAHARSVALIGAGFIGLEAAGALRARGLEVHVIAPEAVPMARVLGDELGRFLVDLHAQAGVQFHLSAEVDGYDGRELLLRDGTRIVADVVLVGAGVVPRTSLASAAGLTVDEGIVVDNQLRTSVTGIYAAGDVARYPYRGELVRVDHWVHAQRQGQAAAANLLGAAQPFVDVPFFWTHHQGVDLRVCGRAAGWDEVVIQGNVSQRDFVARYLRGGQLIAAASVGRDRELLAIERALFA
jgi:NADPH-dependent 2,4-dienoyl-CoA reductase/sulfur reductase-like enzyme/nitrite reductase/ring-hydroxylating ferredoxin subunit